MIKRIKIRDFKSIRDVDLELDPVTVLVGRSGTGKSNLVQAIRFLRNLLINCTEAINYEGGWERIKPVGEKLGTKIEVTFSVPGEEKDYNYQLDFGINPNPTAFVRPAPSVPLMKEALSFGTEYLFSRKRAEHHRWVWDKAPDIIGSPPDSDAPVIGSLPSLQKVVLAYAALSNGIGFYHFPSATLTSDSQAKKPFASIPGLSDDGSNYREVIRGITQDFHHPHIRKNLLNSLQQVNSNIESVELDSLTNPTRAVIGHKANGRIFSLNLEQESDGLRRFYAHLLALYQTPPKLTLIFEEPENAIFPGALSVLADEFKAAPGENRGQVILTTHSPIFLDAFDVDNVRTVEMRNGATVVGRVSKEQREAVKENLLTTGQLLTVDRARLDEEPAAKQAV